MHREGHSGNTGTGRLCKGIGQENHSSGVDMFISVCMHEHVCTACIICVYVYACSYVCTEYFYVLSYACIYCYMFGEIYTHYEHILLMCVGSMATWYVSMFVCIYVSEYECMNT